jgi:hypothetical protein
MMIFVDILQYGCFPYFTQNIKRDFRHRFLSAETAVTDPATHELSRDETRILATQNNYYISRKYRDTVLRHEA